MGDQYDETARAVLAEAGHAMLAYGRPEAAAVIAAALRAAVQAEREHIAVNVLEQTEAQCSLVLRRTRLTDREREWATAEIVREAVAAVHEAPLLTAAPRVEAQGEDEHAEGDEYEEPADPLTWRLVFVGSNGYRRFESQAGDVLGVPGGHTLPPTWTRVRRGGPQP
jgi:hypothetical protein